MQAHRILRLGIVATVAFTSGLTYAQGAPPAGAVGAEPAAPQAAEATPAPVQPSTAPAGAPAVAAPSAEPQPPMPVSTSPAIYVEQPALPPLEPRNRHFHDGFYLRMSVGFGGLWTSSSVSKSDASSDVSGSGGSLDIMAGGTPAPGLVVGGGLLLQEAFNPAVPQPKGQVINGFDPGTINSLPFGMLGPMIDAFPNPSGGFHFGGLLGLAQLGLKDNQGNSSGGVGLAAWAGYMWWASSQWSVGGLLRASAAWTGRKVGDEPNQFDVRDNTRALNLMFSAAFH